MFNVLTRLFAHCKLEPPTSGILPDLNDFRDGGAVVVPPPYELRFTRREDALLP